VTHRLSDNLATSIERKDGLPCGRCGGRHVETRQELESVEAVCTCPCCHGPWGEMFETEYPDLITTRGGLRVITQAAFDEAIRRMEAEIGWLEREV
jgi:hypothetical protein